MKVIKAFPPNYRAINDRFNVRGGAVIFCYGDRIYNPSGIVVGPDLLRHEQIHSVRQLCHVGGVENWWQQYIRDSAFRLAEEIPAHQAEYTYWKSRADAESPVKGFRSAAEFHRAQIALRLSGNLYGNLLSLTEARSLLAA